MKTFKVVLALCAATAMVAAAGCSDTTARDMAADALAKAEAAQTCCDTNTERLDRAYQKVMSK